MGPFEIELNIKKSTTRFPRWKIFLFSFFIVFIMTTIQNLGFKDFNILSPLPFRNSTFDKIIPKIEEKPNNFKLNKPISIVFSTFASSNNYDSANSYVAVDYDTGQILLQKDMSKKFPIASLTKLMTAIVSLDLAKPSDQIIISQKASNEEPTTIGVVKGQKMSVEELLNASLLTSANDAAQALKDGINEKYKDDIFVKAMNEKAHFLKLDNTSFSNPQGFDSNNNYSSAEDLAVIARYGLSNYPLITGIVKKDYQFIPANVNHKQFDLYNWNGLLDVYPGIEGVKIGNTDNAGYTTVVMSERQGKKVLAVLLGAPGVMERDLWASQILDDAFQKLSGLEPIRVSESNLHQKYTTWKYWN